MSEDVKEPVKEPVKDVIDKVEKIVDTSAYVKADDWFGHHNIMSRLIIVACVGILIYAFVAPLSTELVTLAVWLIFGIFVLISFGINSIKTVGEVIVKIRSNK